MCFGLNRDDQIKKGQIAHLDQNRDNNDLRNLVYLCLEHHDEYDSRTSQSKGLTRTEIERYRDELTDQLAGWSARSGREGLLNFLASQIDIDMMVQAAIRAGGSVVFYGEEHAFDVLITDNVDYCDGDLYMPHLIVLDHFASWGWLTYTEEERPDEEDDMPRVWISVARKPVCDEVAARLLKRRQERGEDVSSLLRTAGHRGW
ncbi:MAG: hypothetical protein K8F62_15675, partial [Pseudorhodoplanes sp.]|nr:hypothetical protein [Pseudorhodoplanes sp.]